MASEASRSSKVCASLNYVLPDEGGDPRDYYAGSAGILRRKFDPRTVEVTDIRETSERFCVDTHGFQLVQYPGRFNRFDDWFQIIDQYFPEMVQLVKKHTGASQVRAIQHLVRNETFESAMAEAEGKADLDAVTKLAPGRVVHVDQSYTGARGYMEEFVGKAEASKLSKTRWGIINVWKPIKTFKIFRDPLAVCDARSVSEDDLCAISVKRPKNNRRHVKDMETWQLYANPQHRWHYTSQMTPEEAYLIKIFDSQKDGRARRTPHSAFTLQEEDLVGQARQSVEVRCLVFWQDEKH